MLECCCLSLRWAGVVTVFIKAGVMTANVEVLLHTFEVIAAAFIWRRGRDGIGCWRQWWW